MYRSVYKISILFLILFFKILVFFMNRSEYIVFLRDEIGLGFRQIARIVYPEEYAREPDKTELKVYGLYVKKKNITKTNRIISYSSGISQDIKYYVKTKIHESHDPLYLGDLRKKRLELARELKYEKDKRKRLEIYREINKIKLLELLIIVYDLIGLSEHDKDRMYLLTIYNIGRKLVERIPLEKDHVKWRKTGIDHLSEHAAAFLYITYFITLYNTQYQWLLEKVRELVYTIMKGRSREKKVEKIQRIIQEVYGDVIPKIILRL